MNLPEIVREDIEDWLRNGTRLFFNERDMQVSLAARLEKTGRYDSVMTEYFVPNDELKPDYVWDSELRIDIVVSKGGEWVAIELKYKTKAIREPVVRFGESIEGKSYTVVKNHGAQDLGMYDFWKDVRRLELVGRRFKAVKGGLALFMTNDATYLRCPKENSINCRLSMSAGRKSPDCSWTRQSGSTAGRPDFTLDRHYDITWRDTPLEGQPFKTLILETD